MRDINEINNALKILSTTLTKQTLVGLNRDEVLILNFHATGMLILEDLGKDCFREIVKDMLTKHQENLWPT